MFLDEVCGLFVPKTEGQKNQVAKSAKRNPADPKTKSEKKHVLPETGPNLSNKFCDVVSQSLQGRGQGGPCQEGKLISFGFTATTGKQVCLTLEHRSELH